MADGLATELGDIGAASITSAGVNATNQKIIGTGSPTGYGLSIQTGSFNASNVAVAVSFGTAFALAPTFVYLTVIESGAAATHPGTVTGISAGSFTALGESGLDYAYLAVGSGII